MRETVTERARRRVEQRAEAAAFDAALERARDDLSRLSETAAEAAASIPSRVDDAIREGLREEVQPVARNLAEIRGLLNQVVRRLEALERGSETECRERVEDLALLVDLVGSGWQNVDERLARLESIVAGADSGNGVTNGNGNGDAVPARIADAA
ncbi:MAG TPA: hypothetical protein VE736_11760 [Gaiellaceae bacterium]|nr:hypothetical protein [Gaiellaceae bacterium]